MSIELPVTTRHRRDMTDNVESDVKPEQTNKQINMITALKGSHFYSFLFLYVYDYMDTEHCPGNHVLPIKAPYVFQ